MAEQRKTNKDSKWNDREFLLRCFLIAGLIVAFLKLLHEIFYFSESWSHQKIRKNFYYENEYRSELNSLQELIPLENLGRCLFGLTYILIFIHHMYRGASPIHFLHFLVVYCSTGAWRDATFDSKSISPLTSALWALWIIAYFVWSMVEFGNSMERIDNFFDRAEKDNKSGNDENLKSGKDKAENPTDNQKKMADKEKGEAQVKQIYPEV